MSFSFDEGHFDSYDFDLTFDTSFRVSFDQVPPFEYEYDASHKISENCSPNPTGTNTPLTSTDSHSGDLYDSRKRSISLVAPATGTLSSKKTRRFDTKELQDETAETRKKGACMNCQKARQRVKFIRPLLRNESLILVNSVPQDQTQMAPANDA